MAVMIQITL